MSVPKRERIFAFITGASRGIGREIAASLAVKSASGSVLFLAARNEANLLAVKREIQENNAADAELFVKTRVLDLETSIEVDAIEREVSEALEDQKFDKCYIFHNAATVGDLTKRSNELNDEADWHNYLQTNLISTIRINNKIFEVFKKKEQSEISVIDITSLLAVKAFPSFTQYSVGKASREAYFRAFALENPECKVLSYSPGPVDTDMHSEVAQRSYDETVRQSFAKQDPNTDDQLHRKKLTPQETVVKLLKILEENSFESGTRIDYFD